MARNFRELTDHWIEERKQRNKEAADRIMAMYLASEEALKQRNMERLERIESIFFLAMGVVALFSFIVFIVHLW